MERVVFRGRRAVGVVALVQGERRRFDCGGEIIVSAGALLSPKLLQLSGIGAGGICRPWGWRCCRIARVSARTCWNTGC